MPSECYGYMRKRFSSCPGTLVLKANKRPASRSPAVLSAAAVVIKRVVRSAPPNVHEVTFRTGISIISSMSPSGATRHRQACPTFVLTLLQLRSKRLLVPRNCPMASLVYRRENCPARSQLIQSTAYLITWPARFPDDVIYRIWTITSGSRWKNPGTPGSCCLRERYEP